MSFIALLIWVLFMVITWTKAGQYNRSKIGWTLVGLILSPFISIICLLILGKDNDGSNHA